MLPTDKAEVGMIGFDGKNYHLFDQSSANISNGYGFYFVPQHLYFLSFGGSEAGEWTVFTDTSNGVIESYNKPIKAQWNYGNNGIYNFRVIATTEPSLNLPYIPFDFLGSFYNNIGLNEVLVDYSVVMDQVTEMNIMEYGNDRENFACGISKYELVPDITSNCKENYTKEEIISFIKWLKHLDDGEVHYNPHTHEDSASIGFSPWDCFSDDIMTEEELLDKWVELNIK